MELIGSGWTRNAKLEGKDRVLNKLVCFEHERSLHQIGTGQVDKLEDMYVQLLSAKCPGLFFSDVSRGILI